MRIDDLTVEVRDSSFARVGQLLPTDLANAKFIKRFNNVGSWEIKISADSPMAELLRTPGSGIIVSGPQGVLLSGPMLSAKLEQTQENTSGDWLISGVDDNVLLSERLAYPDPQSANVSTQFVSHDVRTGSAETVLKGYVEANIGPAAPTARRIPGLVIEPDQERGTDVIGRARFAQLQELLYPLAQTGAVGYEMRQLGDGLEFTVYEPEDLSAEIRLDIQNNKLASTEYNYLAPKTTRVVVAGQGESIDRLFLERTNAEAIEAEVVWGRRIESFQDARDVEDVLQLEQRGDERLVDEGKTQVAISVQPSDDINMRYGYEWDLGDKVTVVVDQIEAVAVVTEIGIAITSSGVYLGATVGTPVAIDFESKLISKSEDQEVRISNLERSSSGFGRTVPFEPMGGTIGGTQPTWSGSSPISGSYMQFGNLLHFNISVDFDNITNFGTGQYYLTLPRPAIRDTLFPSGFLTDVSSGKHYAISGLTQADSDQLLLFYTASNGQQDAFTHNSPVNLDQADDYQISGIYEIEPDN
jgi:hypothetical protein